jgi:hypothetical protein
MSKPLPRLHLRVAQDNPIYSVPAGQRNQKADEWLRIGATTEKLEMAAAKIEKLLRQIGTNGSISIDEDPNIDPKQDPNFERDMKLIKSIMSLGG